MYYVSCQIESSEPTHHFMCNSISQYCVGNDIIQCYKTSILLLNAGWYMTLLQNIIGHTMLLLDHYRHIMLTNLLYLTLNVSCSVLYFVCIFQGKYNGKSGYFPAKYVLRIEPGQQIYQVLRTINLTEMDGLSGIRLHKDQVRVLITID